MFKDMWDENDLELTENRLRVHVLTLKKKGDPYPLLRLYGPLSLVLARRGDSQGAQDALNDAEFLVVEHKWRGTDKEAWIHLDRARVMQAFGREKFARRSVERAIVLLTSNSDPELRRQVDELGTALGMPVVAPLPE
jgi:hypothetical protein